MTIVRRREMSILQNGIDSIALGIEDYKSSDPRRLISCTRNLLAGILLLFKHKLKELSPADSDDVLIKQRILPIIDSKIGLMWKGKGKKTVDIQQIRERFDNLGIVLDWDKVEQINNFRNDIEHYYSQLSQNAIRSLIANSFIIIRDFVRIHLERDPLTLLGSETWRVLTDVAEVYEKEKQECIQNIKAIDWKSYSLENALIEFCCPECGSGLIDVNNGASDKFTAEFICRSCGTSWTSEPMIEQAIGDYFGAQNYSAIKDGDEPATITCPNCGKDTYILEEDICVACEESIERTCHRCGMEIPACELNGDGYCGWCAHMMLKDD